MTKKERKIYQTDWSRARYKRLLNDGLCPNCGGMRTDNRKLCEKCINSKKKSNYELRRKVLEAYGNKCSCCGESNVKFLSVDHINGGGRKQRNKLGGNFQFFRWLIKNNFPKEEYQILCYNCNIGRQFNHDYPGICPHKEEI